MKSLSGSNDQLTEDEIEEIEDMPVVDETIQMLLSRLWSPLEPLYDRGRATIVSLEEPDSKDNTLVIILPHVRYSQAIGLRDLRPDLKEEKKDDEKKP